MGFRLKDIAKLFFQREKQFRFFISRTTGYWPRRTALFHQALIHKSALARGCKPHECNERLEYLGDAVLEAIVSDTLYHLLPYADEGELSKLRATLVCRQRLNDIAYTLGITNHIRCSSPNMLQHTHLPGDAVEALVAAIYLDGGLKEAQRFVLKHVASLEQINKLLSGDDTLENYKSELLELCQKKHKEVIFDSTPTIANGHSAFRTEVRISGKTVGEGIGQNKKQADQRAAQIALRKLRR